MRFFGRPIRFSLRALLVVVVVLSVPLAVANNWLSSIRRQRAIVEQLAPFQPRTVFSAGQLKLLHLEDPSLSDRNLKSISTLNALEWLTLESVRLTDDSLRELRGLTKLQYLAPMERTSPMMA